MIQRRALGAVLLVILFAASCGAGAEVLATNVQESVSGFDYGYDVVATVRAKSWRKGFTRIELKATLTCSQGTWSQTRVVPFAPDETKNVTFSFKQPTIEAKDPAAIVEVLRTASSE